MNKALEVRADGLNGGARKLLLACGRMPFASTDILGRIAGISKRYAQSGLSDMEKAGFMEVIARRSSRGIAEYRWCVSADGVAAIAHLSGRSVKDVTRDLPVSLQWQRRILSRLDAADAFYAVARVAATYAGVNGWRWRGRGWVGGDLDLGNNRIAQVMRLGRSVSRRASLYRLGTMTNDVAKNRVYSLIVIAPDNARMRLIERWVNDRVNGVDVWVVNERDLLEAPEERIWSKPVWLGLGYRNPDVVFANLPICGETALRWARQPYVYKQGDAPNIDGLEDEMRFAGLHSGAVEYMDGLLDWPMAHPGIFYGLSGVSKVTGSQRIRELTNAGFVGQVDGFGGKRWCLTNEGLRRLAIRDQTKVGEVQRLWGVEPTGVDGQYTPIGGAIKKLALEIGHTDGCYEILGKLISDCDESDIGLVELLPAHRSERWLAKQRRGRIIGVKPDASIVIDVPDFGHMPVMIEFERRADKPSLYEEKLEKYIRYYSMSLKMEDWRQDVLTLFVFADKMSASRFAAHCEQALAKTKERIFRMKLFVSSVEEIEIASWFAPIWIRGGALGKGRIQFWK